MRYLAPLIVIIAAQVGAAWALGDANTARPGASFATFEAETPAACERLCADDTLCMAWNFHANSCELKAVVPPAVAQEGVTSGLSARAPASMRVRFEAAVAPATRVVEAQSELPSSEAPPEDDISLALLGGPETDESLRARLEN